MHVYMFYVDARVCSCKLTTSVSIRWGNYLLITEQQLATSSCFSLQFSSRILVILSQLPPHCIYEWTERKREIQNGRERGKERGAERDCGGEMASLILEQRVIPRPLPRLLKINFAVFKHPLHPRDHCWMDQSGGERGMEGGCCLATVIWLGTSCDQGITGTEVSSNTLVHRMHTLTNELFNWVQRFTSPTRAPPPLSEVDKVQDNPFFGHNCYAVFSDVLFATSLFIPDWTQQNKMELLEKSFHHSSRRAWWFATVSGLAAVLRNAGALEAFPEGGGGGIMGVFLTSFLAFLLPEYWLQSTGASKCMT